MSYAFSEGLGRVVEIDDSSGSLLVCRPGNELFGVSATPEEIHKFAHSPRRFLSEAEAEAFNRSLAERDPENTSPPSK